MLRILVLLLVIATPLLSQDLLVDSIDREFSGTLIEITDTDIIFQIQGETEPVRYPFWAVKRVTLADGRLAFEDGKTYVTKPTLPVKAKPAEPAPTVPKPEEPLPMEKADDEKDKRPPLLSQDLLVDSEGGEYSGTLIEITDTHIYFQLPGRTTPIQIPLKSVKRVTLADGSIAYEGEPEPENIEIAAGEVGLEAAPEDVIASAEAEAVRSQNMGQNRRIGVAGCLFTWIGLPITTLYVESGASSGFDKNSRPSAAAYHRGLSPELQLVYEQAYQNKVKSLRRKSVYGTQLFCFGAFIGYIFLAVMAGP